MTDPYAVKIRPFIPDGKIHMLQEVEDEIYLDLPAGVGTQVLARTCYGRAVRDCERIGSDQYILKVIPELRRLLLRELRGLFTALRVYRFQGDATNRILLTGRMHVRFESYAQEGDGLEGLEQFFVDLPEEETPPEGIFTLAPKYAEDPILACRELGWNAQIEQVTPVAASILPFQGESTETPIPRGLRPREMRPSVVPPSPTSVRP
jgi:hypothetical protein